MKKTFTLFFLSLINLPAPLLAMQKRSGGSPREGMEVTQFLLEKAKKEAEERLNYLALLQDLMHLSYKQDTTNQDRLIITLKNLLNEIFQKNIVLKEKEISSIQCGPDKQPLLLTTVMEVDLDCFDALLQHHVNVEEGNKMGQTATTLALAFHKALPNEVHSTMATQLAEYQKKRVERKLRKSMSQ